MTLDPATLRMVLLVLVTAGYLALLIRMAAEGLLLRLPVFWSYVFLLAMKGCRWIYWRAVAPSGSTPTPWFRETETVILALKCLVILEAWWAVTRAWHEQPRRRLFLTLLGVATLAGVAMAWLPPEPNLTRAYVRQALKLHVGLGIFCGGFMLVLWRRWEWLPETPRLAWQHGLILTAHVLARWTDLIPYHSRPTTEERVLWYWWQQGIFLAASLACIVAWWRVLRRRAGAE